jgi:AcrR family transcriptional regulator
MPRDALTTRGRILESAYGLFYRDGFERSGIEAVADAAGVTKRTLYNHFSSKDALIAEVLEAQTDLAAEQIERWCRAAPPTPEALVEEIFTRLRDWSQSPEWRGSGFTRAAMELAWAPGHPARRAAATQKTAYENALSEALGSAGAAEPRRFARALVLLIEGSMALRLIHGEETWFDEAEDAALALAQKLSR